MSRYRHALPQLSDRITLTDGGIETTLIYHDGIELPDFAAFRCSTTPAGRAALSGTSTPTRRSPRDAGIGIVLETPTWRASRDWGARLGYTPSALAEVNRRGRRARWRSLRVEYATGDSPVVISGCIGPRGDGYQPGRVDDVRARPRDYHALQVASVRRRPTPTWSPPSP